MTRNALQSALIGGTAILSMVGLSACDQQMADAPESTELAAAAPADGQAVGDPEPE